MFDTFNEIFDLNNDNQLDPAEQTLEYMVIDDMLNDDDNEYNDEDDSE